MAFQVTYVGQLSQFLRCFDLMLKFFYGLEKEKTACSPCTASPWHSWKSVDGSLDRCYVAMADSTLKSDGPESTNIRPGSTDGVHCSWQPRRLHTSQPLKTARLHVPPNNCASALFVYYTVLRLYLYLPNLFIKYQSSSISISKPKVETSV